MKHNILLIIVDCLRYDRVTEKYMPLLTEFGEQNTTFTNFWSVSHCTDPVITSLLTGKWPDDLRLYSMMYGTDWNLTTGVKMLAETAKENGYSTAMISNLVRWYQRGVDHYVDNRGWYGGNTFGRAYEFVKDLEPPWFMTVHDDSCHTNYRGGSYDAACADVDVDIAKLVNMDGLKEKAFIIITSDHGEGLGQYGINQHGFGLWPELTHVPLIVSSPGITTGMKSTHLRQHVHMYDEMKWVIEGEAFNEKTMEPYNISYAHMVGRTPNWWHRGVTDGEILVVKQQDAKGGGVVFTKLEFETGANYEYHISGTKNRHWNAARAHAALFGLNADDDTLADDDILEQRLRALGYFE